MSQLRSSPSETFSSGVFQLPPEILVYIAKYLLAAESKTKYQFTAFQRPNYRALLPLSMSHSYWRNICVTAGLFSFIRPRYDPVKMRRVPSPRASGESLTLSFGIPLLTGIMIDLSAPNVWDFCGTVIAESPALRELGFTKSIRGDFESFRRSRLWKGCASFQGSSLVLRDARFNWCTLEVIFNLRKCNITCLSLERSGLEIEEDEMEVLGAPLFPGLQKVRFLGEPFQSVTDNARDILLQINLAKMFLVGAKISHFEMSYGFKPRLSRQRKLLGSEKRLKTNVLYLALRRRLLQVLRSSSNESLKVFIELDQIEAPFFGKNLLFYWSSKPPPAVFKSMDLLVLRCEGLESIAKFNGIDNCLVDVDIRANWPQGPSNDHSVWIYLSTLFTFFSKCKGIYIETTPGATSIGRKWWDFASQRVTYILESMESPPLWQYFIVGNACDGYSGIRRKDNDPTVMDDFQNISGCYEYLQGSKCKDLVSEGW
jgi:hypothetical protein